MGGVHRGDRGNQGSSSAEVVLDTDVFSYLYRDLPAAEPFRSLVPARSAVAFPTVAELLFGAAKAGWGPSRLLQLEVALAGVTILQSDAAVDLTCALARAEAVRLGHPLAHQVNANDLWIAACAIRHQLPLVTGNLRHFTGIPGLVVLAPEPVR